MERPRGKRTKNEGSSRKLAIIIVVIIPIITPNMSLVLPAASSIFGIELLIDAPRRNKNSFVPQLLITHTIAETDRIKM